MSKTIVFILSNLMVAITAAIPAALLDAPAWAVWGLGFLAYLLAGLHRGNMILAALADRSEDG